jgi:elongation factor G
MAFAIEAKAKGDEEKIGNAVRRLQEEDPTIDFHRDQQTGEQIIAGLSQVHVEVIVDRMKRRFGAEVNLKPPRVPYQETIKGSAKAQGRYKKQTGGRGQFGDCSHRDRATRAGRRLRVREPDQGRRDPVGVHPGGGEGHPRGDAGRRGRRLSAARRSHPSLRRLLPHGGLIGDAFKIAARWRSRRPPSRLSPRLLEPIMQVQVVVPEDAVGDVIGDLNGPPRPAARHGAEGLDDRDQGRGPDGGDAQLRARPALDHRAAAATTRWSSRATRRCRPISPKK